MGTSSSSSSSASSSYSSQVTDPRSATTNAHTSANTDSNNNKRSTECKIKITDVISHSLSLLPSSLIDIIASYAHVTQMTFVIIAGNPVTGGTIINEIIYMTTRDDGTPTITPSTTWTRLPDRVAPQYHACTHWGGHRDTLMSVTGGSSQKSPDIMNMDTSTRSLVFQPVAGVQQPGIRVAVPLVPVSIEMAVT
jgi:hypothetical protein